jgi:hypothetical protein
MLKWRGKGVGGRDLIGFALTPVNIKRLYKNDPIYFQLRQLGDDLPDIDIVIDAGEDVEKVKADIDKMIREKFE